MVDWNGDGYDDLITGEGIISTSSNIHKAKVRLYLGKSQTPVFDGYIYMQADDSDIVVPACYY